MFVNPKKFQVLFLSRKKEFITSDTSLNINGSNIISSNWAKLLGIKFGSGLNFEPHISDLRKSAATQLIVVLRLNFYPTLEARKIPIESFVYPLVWKFTSARAIKKLRVYKKEPEDSYLAITKFLVKLVLWREIDIKWPFKGLVPSYIKNVLKKLDTLRSKWTHHQNNLIVLWPNYYEFCTKSLASLEPKTWNSFAVNVKSVEKFKAFRKLINTWDREMRNCRLYTYNKKH